VQGTAAQTEAPNAPTTPMEERILSAMANHTLGLHSRHDETQKLVQVRAY